MSDLAEADRAVPRLMRDRSRVQRVTNIELFFDLVYVFAVTELSYYLLHPATVTGALQAGLLLVMAWLVWAYPAWVTNWLDPDRMAVRLLLVAPMLISVAMSASLPRAFEDLGLWVGAAYAVQQIGRTVFMVIALALAVRAISALALGACAAAVAITDRLPWLPRPEDPAPAAV
jgi:low temperature requirement protein LtrA